jgi:hypothetical protein
MLGLWIVGLIIAVLWLATKLGETREELRQVTYERDVYARELDTLTTELAEQEEPR